MIIDKNAMNTKAHKRIRSRSFSLSRFADACFVVFVPVNVESPFRRRHIYSGCKSRIARARKARLLFRKFGIANRG